jgi:hypothetical protein
VPANIEWEQKKGQINAYFRDPTGGGRGNILHDLNPLKIPYTEGQMQQDPVFSDPELVKILSYYLTPRVMNLLAPMSPYTPGSGNERWKSKYDAIVAIIGPMLKKPNPDIHAIIQVVDKQIPIVGMPTWIKDVILSADQRYKQAELAYQKNQADRKNWRPTGDKQAGNWVIVDEPPDTMPAPFKP